MRGSPVVSVVTPTLNQARYLTRAIESVRAQSYSAVEHIVIDGGSTDETIEILRRAGDGGGIRWVTEPDDGMYEAVNKGLGLATGEVLAYLNSDDAYMPWTIEVVVRAFRANPDVDLLFGDGIKLNESTGAQRLRLFSPFDRVSLANYESIMQPAVFWRRRLFERIGGFDVGMRYAADLDYWLRAAGAGARIAHVNEVLAVERNHEGRLSVAQSLAASDEGQVMRARHAGAAGGPEGRQRAMAREVRWQRWIWLRFLTAFALRPLPGPWGRFFRDGDVKVRPQRVLRGTGLPKFSLLWNAVISPLAADVLGASGENAPRRRRRTRRRPRLRLLWLALPRLVASRYRLVTRRGPAATSAKPQAAK